MKKLGTVVGHQLDHASVVSGIGLGLSSFAKILAVVDFLACYHHIIVLS